jgi:hypothetical protein
MHFWWSRSQAGRVSDVEVLTTSPVVDFTVTDIFSEPPSADENAPEKPNAL